MLSYQCPQAVDKIVEKCYFKFSFEKVENKA